MLSFREKVCPKLLRYTEDFGILPADALDGVAVYWVSVFGPL